MNGKLCNKLNKTWKSLTRKQNVLKIYVWRPRVNWVRKNENKHTEVKEIMWISELHKTFTKTILKLM